MTANAIVRRVLKRAFPGRRIQVVGPEYRRGVFLIHVKVPGHAQSEPCVVSQGEIDMNVSAGSLWKLRAAQLAQHIGLSSR